MSLNTQIPNEEWLEFFATFSNGNRGRQVSVQVIDPVSGDAGKVAQGKLLAVDYDPIDKGNDIIVTLGTDEIDATHSVTDPAELWRAQRDTGEIAALEVVDQNGARTILSL